MEAFLTSDQLSFALNKHNTHRCFSERPRDMFRSVCVLEIIIRMCFVFDKEVKTNFILNFHIYFIPFTAISGRILLKFNPLVTDIMDY